MAFLTGLCSIGLLLLAAGYIFHIPFLLQLQHDMRISAAVMFFLIGFFHLVQPRKLVYLIEGMLPAPYTLILFTGIMEMLLAIGLLFPFTQYYAGWGLIMLLIFMFLANIRVAVKKLPPPGGLPAKAWYTWSRLLFQPVYILWVWWAVR